MRMEQNKVIVIGGNHHNTLGVIRSLGYKGIRPYVVVITDHKKPYVCYSKYVQHFYTLSSSTEIVDYLLCIKDANSIKPVLVSCADFVTAVLDSNQAKLSEYYYLPVGNGNIVQMMNKDTMASIANECGINTPRTIKLEEALFNDNKRLILKPLKSIEGTKADISIVSSQDELISFISSSSCSHFQIQEFIDKDIEFQLIGCSLNKGETVIIPGASIILRQPENTNTGFLKYVGFEEFQFEELNKCRKFIQAVGYSGLFSLEFLRGKDGVDYFMEMNMRNDGNSICVTAAGVNLPYIWYNHCIGSEDWKEESSNTIHNTIVMPEFDDFINVLKHKIPFSQWKKDIRRTDCFMEYDRTDEKPFFMGLWQQLTNYGKLFFRKLSSK